VRHTARRWERRPLDGQIVLTPTTANDGSAAYELVVPFDFGRVFRAVLDCPQALWRPKETPHSQTGAFGQDHCTTG
jgi:hypothetical protein